MDTPVTFLTFDERVWTKNIIYITFKGRDCIVSYAYSGCVYIYIVGVALYSGRIYIHIVYLYSVFTRLT